MQPPLFISPLSAAEARELKAGLRSRDAFSLRRSQILLASARGYHSAQIAEFLGCDDQTVRNALHAFRSEGLGCLTAKSSTPHRVQAIWSKARDDELRELLHQSPRIFGKSRSTWTLQLIAQVCFEQGMTSRELSAEAIRLTLERLDINWKRAKHWMTSPDPNYALKKARARSSDSPVCPTSGMGAGLRGRGVVEPDSPALGTRLDSRPADEGAVAEVRR